MVFQLHDGRRVLDNTTADEPRKQDGQAFQFYPAKKYCAETEARNCEGTQTRGAGDAKVCSCAMKKSSFLPL